MKNIQSFSEFAGGLASQGLNSSNIMAPNGQLIANNATLRHEEHKVYDDKLIEIARKKLRIINDIRSRGLTKNLGSVGDLLTHYERVGDMTSASISMDAKTRGQKDRTTFDQVAVPVPVFHKEFEINWRQLEASRNRGEALDTTNIGLCTTLVTEEMETAVYNGIPGLTVSGSTVYGLTTHPDRNTGTLTASWATATGAQIKTDVKAMIAQAIGQNFYGPFVLYVSRDVWPNLQDDYSTTKGDNTIKQRVEDFAEIDEVRVGHFLAADTVLMVQMTEDVIDLAVAQDIRKIQFNLDPFSTDYKVFSIMVPRIKSEKDGRSGVSHWTV